MEIHTLSIWCHIFFLTMFSTQFSAATDTLTRSQTITDNTSLVSARGKFQLGFFSPDNSMNRYLGIWFNNIPQRTIIWVANRETPLNDSTGVLRIGRYGNLIITYQDEIMAWSSNVNNIEATTVAQLLDSGNLVLRDEKDENLEKILWQSFDHPSNTLVAGMKLGWDLEIGLNRFLTSWKNEDDPSNGSFRYGFDLYGLPQVVIHEGSVKKQRSGLWDGSQFSGTVVTPNLAFIPTVVTNSKEVYYKYDLSNESTITMLVMSHTGSVQRHVWEDSTRGWRVMSTLPRDRCDNYGECGPNAVCTINDLTLCSCLDGYIPESSQDWDMFIRSGGCLRRKPLNCPEGEDFIEVVGVKLPDLVQFRIEPAFMLDECKVECLKNCSCTAYANLNSTDKSGCLLWFNNLVDLRKLPGVNTKFYLRVTDSELPSGETGSTSKNKSTVFMVVVITGSSVMLLVVASIIIWKKRLQSCRQSHNQETDNENPELSVLSMVTIADATHNFSYSNKIGEGGFGPVYKGILSCGTEIAVKRLSLTSSSQGINEFKNEVTLIAKLQHRNLVRLLGCCIQGDERMLVYEYMSHGSLDSFIFDDGKGKFLGWSRRYDIIIGIARGLLYLHRDSRLRIIHRDLKASNVLLDSDMNPKISDFGTARAFGADQKLAKTKRVIGTYGYMSPEYAIDGIFSVKSDVFSFGVLVLEIVSGKRNRQFHHPDHDLNLLGHAWKLWTEGKAFELLDPLMVDSVSFQEVVKCVQVGLLCVQHRPEDRPTMSSLVLLLDSVSVILPQPKHPGFYTERIADDDEEKHELDERIFMTNVLTNTLSVGR